jgi:hypothetical protein
VRALARAVLELAVTDTIGGVGFSTCPPKERRKWKGDAEDFFSSGRFREWAALAEIAERHVLDAAKNGLRAT